MFQNGQKVVVVSSGDPARVIKVQSASGTPDPSRYPIVTTDGVAGRDQSVQIVSGGDPTRFPILRGVSDARGTADSVITALTPAAWYRNATGVTEAGGFASQWDDYSGNGRHLAQTTGTNQPAYAAGVFTFDGADNFMKITADAAIIQPTTIYWVMKEVSWTNVDFIFDGNTTGSGRFIQDSSTPNVSISAGSSIQCTNDPAIGDYFIVCIVFNGASSSIRINNAAADTGNAGASNMGGFCLGSRGDGGALWSNISAKEGAIFLAAHDDTTQSSVITALNDALTVF